MADGAGVGVALVGDEVAVGVGVGDGVSPGVDGGDGVWSGNADADALAPLAARPDYNAQIRTTCVATMLEAGHAENALPQTARATVNCRIMPEESVEEAGRTLARVIGDEKVAIIPKGTAVLSPPSAINPEVM